MLSNSKKILSIQVNATTYEDTVREIMSFVGQNKGRYVCVSNVHMCMEAFDSLEFNKVVNNAALVVPDGLPLVFGLKLLGQKDATQIRGTDLFLLYYRLAYSFKRLGLSFYGELGNNRSRFYNPILAEGVTLSGQEFLRRTMTMAEEKGFQPLYGDTDSVLLK